MSYKRIEVPQGSIDEQKRIMALVAEINAAKPRQMFALVDTYGCQQNESDSERLRGMLREMGCEEVFSKEESDITIINTCSIRENADKRFFGTLGQLKKLKEKNPDYIACVCG